MHSLLSASQLKYSNYAYCMWKCVCVSVCSRSALKWKNMWFINLKWKKFVISMLASFHPHYSILLLLKERKKNKYGLMMTTIPINIKWFFNKYTFQPVVVESCGPVHCTLYTYVSYCRLNYYYWIAIICFSLELCSQDWAETQNEQNKIHYQNTHLKQTAWTQFNSTWLMDICNMHIFKWIILFIHSFCLKFECIFIYACSSLLIAQPVYRRHFDRWKKNVGSSSEHICLIIQNVFAI